jgi:hypothetical protein
MYLQFRSRKRGVGGGSVRRSPPRPPGGEQRGLHLRLPGPGNATMIGLGVGRWRARTWGLRGFFRGSVSRTGRTKMARSGGTRPGG